MEYLLLKNSDLEVSRLCFGGCPMGAHGWGKVSEHEMIKAVHRALDEGVNFFDNADIYGLGKSEETLGKALKEKRGKAIIATKFGVRYENRKTFYDNSSNWINTAAEASLRRLGTDYIDLLQVHYRDNQTPIHEVIETLEKLKGKGYIRHFGLSNIHQSDISELKAYAEKFVSFQDEYSLACRKNENDIFTIQDELGLTPLTWGSLGQGILTGKYDINSTFGADDRRSKDIYVNFHGEKLKKNMEIVDVLKAISKNTGKKIPAIAIRFILDFIRNSIVIAGIKNTNQLLSNTEAMGWNLTDEQITLLHNISGNGN
jgi:aryl-alcohol dehydrogenase-like predicted oxidoreductase